MKAEEQSVLVTGLVDALVDLYPELPAAVDDEAFLAVLAHAQTAAHLLRTYIHEANSSASPHTFTVIS